jgi:hypothetical protein
MQIALISYLFSLLVNLISSITFKALISTLLI